MKLQALSFSIQILMANRKGTVLTLCTIYMESNRRNMTRCTSQATQPSLTGNLETEEGKKKRKFTWIINEIVEIK